MRSYFTLLIALLATHPPLGAQSQPDKEFRLLAIQAEAITGIFYDVSGKPSPVLAPVAAPSPSYPLPSGATLHLYKKALSDSTANTPPDAKPTKIPFADISLSGSPPFLILLQPAAPGSPVPYVGQSLTFTRGSQPENSGQFFNLSSRVTAVVYGNAQFVLNPGQSQVVAYSAPKERGENMPFKLGVSNPDKSWTLVQDWNLFKEKGGRQIIFLIDQPDAKTGHTSFKSVLITDWFSPPKPKTQ